MKHQNLLGAQSGGSGLSSALQDKVPAALGAEPCGTEIPWGKDVEIRTATTVLQVRARGTRAAGATQEQSKSVAKSQAASLLAALRTGLLDGLN